MSRDQKQTGFSLIELLIVVAIILIIAAIAIPNLLRARIAANEASAVGSVRTLDTSEITYSATYGTGFAPLASLGGAAGCVAAPATACLIDPVLTAGTKTGYTVAAVAATGAGTILSPFLDFEVNATPISVTTGTRILLRPIRRRPLQHNRHRHRHRRRQLRRCSHDPAVVTSLLSKCDKIPATMTNLEDTILQGDCLEILPSLPKNFANLICHFSPVRRQPKQDVRRYSCQPIRKMVFANFGRTFSGTAP